MKKCINCENSLELNAKFCPECGSKQPEQIHDNKKSDYSASIGDKNVISGNIIGKSEEFNISGPATINKIEDETKKFLLCAVSGKHLLRGRDDVVNCPKCKSDVAQESFNFFAGRCFNCDKTAYAQYSEKLDIVLADGIIDSMERIELDSLALSLMIDTSKKQQLELEARERKANANLNTIGGNSTELSGFYKIQFKKALSLVFESNDLAAATSILFSIHCENIYHDETASLYFLIKAIQNPQQYINDYEKVGHRTDDVYWADFWAFIPYFKTGRAGDGFKIINLNKARFSDNRNDILLSEVLAHLICFSDSRESDYIAEGKSLYAAFGRNIKQPLLKLHEFISKLLSSDEEEWEKSSQNFHSEELFYFNYVLGVKTAGAPINSNPNEINDNSYLNLVEDVSSASSNEIIATDSIQIDVDENGNCWVDESLGLRARNNRLLYVDKNGIQYPTIFSDRSIWLSKNLELKDWLFGEEKNFQNYLPQNWYFPSCLDWGTLASFIAFKNGYYHSLNIQPIEISNDLCSIGDTLVCVDSGNSQLISNDNEYVLVSHEEDNIFLFEISNRKFVTQPGSTKLVPLGRKRFKLKSRSVLNKHLVPFNEFLDYSFIHPKYSIASKLGIDYNKTGYITFTDDNCDEDRSPTDGFARLEVTKNEGGILRSYLKEEHENYIRILTPITENIISQLKKIDFILPDYIQYSELIPSLGNDLSSNIKNIVDKNTNNKLALDYEEVAIGNQVWMKKNLDVETFRNGDPIPHITSDKEWERAGVNKQPAWCYYDNMKKYGKLYNWYAVNDSRGLALAGWHIPSTKEWSILTYYLGGWEVAGTKMKSAFPQLRSGSGWKDRGNGTNESGFSGLPGGYRGFLGTFYHIGYAGYWWSSTEHGTDDAWSRTLMYNNGDVYRYGYGKGRGFSVRCLRD